MVFLQYGLFIYTFLIRDISYDLFVLYLILCIQMVSISYVFFTQIFLLSIILFLCYGLFICIIPVLELYIYKLCNSCFGISASISSRSFPFSFHYFPPKILGGYSPMLFPFFFITFSIFLLSH